MITLAGNHQQNKSSMVFGMLALSAAGIFVFSIFAAGSFAVGEPETGALSGPSTILARTDASGGKLVKFGGGVATPPPPTPAPAPAPTIPPPIGMPSKQAIMSGAGPNNPGALRASGSVTVSTDGAVIQDLDITGSVTVNANNVTLRNCKVRGFSSSFLVRLTSGHSNFTIDHCRIEAVPNSSGAGPNGAIGGDGSTSHIVVRNSEVLGYADGIKANDYSLYEYNYIHMVKPSGSTKHLDGIQGSGDSHWMARYNVLLLGIENGGNFSLFAQGFNGTICKKIVDVEFSNNYIYGGNYGMQFAGGKANVCANPGSYGEDLRSFNNIFLNDPDGLGKSDVNNLGFRYGYMDAQSVTFTKSGNRLENGTPVN